MTILAKDIGPRVSVASLFRNVSLRDYSTQYYAKDIGTSALSYFKL
jgi:hypothetical protein